MMKNTHLSVSGGFGNPGLGLPVPIKLARSLAFLLALLRRYLGGLAQLGFSHLFLIHPSIRYVDR